MKKCLNVLIVCILVVIFSSIGGCASAKEDIARSKALMDQGTTAVEKISTSDAHSVVKSRYNEAKVNYEQALGILNNAKTDSDDESKLIEFYKQKCNFYIQLWPALISLEDMWGHYEKSFVYIDSNEFQLAHNEVIQGKKDLSTAMANLQRAKDVVDSINYSIVPAEDKARYEKWRTLDELINLGDAYETLFDAQDSLITAFDLTNQAQIFINNNDAPNAKVQLTLAKAQFENTKTKIDTLRNIDNTELVVATVNMSNSINQKITAIDQILALLK